MTRGRLASINVSHGGVPKTPIGETFVSTGGVGGDRHRYRFHGGPDRAVVLYSLELIHALQAEGHPIDVGTIGENLTLALVDWNAMVPGIELAIGDARLRVTTFTAPCNTITPSFLNGDASRVSQKAHPGWSRVCARVLVEGTVRVGDRVDVVGEEPPATC